MTAARDVVPQPVEPRSFLRRRRTDEPRPEPPVTPAAAPPVPVVEAPIAVAEPVTLAAPRAEAERPTAALPAQPVLGDETREVFRAKDALLQAALRQCDELSTALLQEQCLRRQETERLTAENALLRDALAALNADALARQQALEAPAAPMVPEQRVETWLAAPAVEPLLPAAPAVAQAPDVEPLDSDVTLPNGRRRSVREVGPA